MQIGMFDGNKEFINDKPIRLIELFGGIGCQAKALTNLGIEFEHYRMCDFDKYAVQSYNAVHGTNFEPSDITKITAEDLGIVETDKYTYIMTYSFPCTDLSLAGKQEGMAKDSGTRSGLLWEVERLLNECKELPQILLMENVPQVHGKKNKESFIEWCAFLESKGYKNYWKDLNAKHYGIPQNRNRTFMVSLLGDYYYEFPEPFELKLRLKDMLESEVDEKYYLSEKALNGIIPTLMARDYKDPKLVMVAEPMIIYDTNGVSTAITTGFMPNVAIKEATKQGYALAEPFDSINLEQPNSKTRRGRVGKGVAQTLDCSCNQGIIEPFIVGSLQKNAAVRYDGISPTLTGAMGMGGGQVPIHNFDNFRIRKLTPKECWRLMGLRDTDFDKAKASGVSNSQLYKQAGNGIVVNVLMAIFKNLNLGGESK